MSRWSWHAVEATRGVAVFEAARDGRTLVDVTFRELPGDQATAAMNALCRALAGEQIASAGASTREGEGGARGESSGRQDAVATPADAPSTLRQQRDLHIELAKLGGQYRERAFRLKVISTFVGREIASTKQLTSGEAELVLMRVLEKLAAGGAA